eukprot:EG_transcript_27752
MLALLGFVLLLLQTTGIVVLCLPVKSLGLREDVLRLYRKTYGGGKAGQLAIWGVAAGQALLLLRGLATLLEVEADPEEAEYGVLFLHYAVAVHQRDALINAFGLLLHFLAWRLCALVGRLALAVR